MVKVALLQSPFADNFLGKFVDVSQRAFASTAGKTWINGLSWRLSHMPDVTVFTVYSGRKLIGYKAGYASSYDRYYSWLGAVHPDFQRQGVAKDLMSAQHEWLMASRFIHLETQVAKTNSAMSALNLRSGFTVSGEFLKHGNPYLIMERGV